MSRVCGPILGWRGQDGEAWRVGVMVAHRGSDVPGDIAYGVDDSAATVAPAAAIGSLGNVSVFAAELTVPLGADEQTIVYGFAGEERRWRFVVPARGPAPRPAYASCKGFSLPGDMKKIADKNALWTDVAAEHRRQPFHLLLLGGDQIYADQLWDTIPELARFNERPRAERVRRSAGAALRRAVERFYADIYVGRFSQAEVAGALASIPTLMMWDDHDIFDGWGSYAAEEQASPVFQAIFAAARSPFVLFQLQSDPSTSAPPRLPGQPALNALLRFETAAVLVLDLRSERTQQQILSPESWKRGAGRGRCDGRPKAPAGHVEHSGAAPRHVVSGACLRPRARHAGHRGRPARPVAELQPQDRTAALRPPPSRLRRSPGHQGHILSGDVHVAALGVIQSEGRPVRHVNADAITPLTSSAIVHPPPARVVRYFLEQIGGEVQEIDRDISGQMQVFPGTNYRFVAQRNWMTLDFDDKHRMWVNWRIEDAPQPLTKVVHPCEKVPPPAV